MFRKRNYHSGRRGKTNRLKAKKKLRVIRKKSLSPHGKRSA